MEMEVCSKNIGFFNMKPGDTQSNEQVLKFDPIYCVLLIVHYFHSFVYIYIFEFLQ